MNEIDKAIELLKEGNHEVPSLLETSAHERRGRIDIFIPSQEGYWEERERLTEALRPLARHGYSTGGLYRGVSLYFPQPDTVSSTEFPRKTIKSLAEVVAMVDNPSHMWEQAELVNNVITVPGGTFHQADLLRNNTLQLERAGWTILRVTDNFGGPTYYELHPPFDIPATSDPLEALRRVLKVSEGPTWLNKGRIQGRKVTFTKALDQASYMQARAHMSTARAMNWEVFEVLHFNESVVFTVPAEALENVPA